MEQITTGAEHIRWDLSDLYAGEDALLADLEGAEGDAGNFAATYRGSIHELSASALSEALQQLESIYDRAGRAYTYAYLPTSR